MSVRIDDHSDEVKAAFTAALNKALETIGLVAEGNAKRLCTVDTGRLRNSIGYAVDAHDKCVCIGTNITYAVYVELGTGQYYAGGRDTPWSYKDAKGNWHTTKGARAQPYLRPAVENYAATYRGIANDAFKNA